jgi:hypothetical protein
VFKTGNGQWRAVIGREFGKLYHDTPQAAFAAVFARLFQGKKREADEATSDDPDVIDVEFNDPEPEPDDDDDDPYDDPEPDSADKPSDPAADLILDDSTIWTVADECRRRDDCRYGLKGVKMMHLPSGQVLVCGGSKWGAEDPPGTLTLLLYTEMSEEDTFTVPPCPPGVSLEDHYNSLSDAEVGIVHLSDITSKPAKTLPAAECVLLDPWPCVCCSPEPDSVECYVAVPRKHEPPEPDSTLAPNASKAVLDGKLTINHPRKSREPILEVAVYCPRCRQNHVHGWPGNDIDAETHRISHCTSREGFSDYMIRLDPALRDEHEQLLDDFMGALMHYLDANPGIPEEDRRRLQDRIDDIEDRAVGDRGDVPF